MLLIFPFAAFKVRDNVSKWQKQVQVLYRNVSRLRNFLFADDKQKISHIVQLEKAVLQQKTVS